MTPPLNATDDREIQLTNPDGLGVTSSAFESADNKYPEGWVPFFPNPWIEPGKLLLTGEGEESNAPADQFVARSRAALRKWMDENPY